MKRLRRQLPFLRSVLKEANRFKRQKRLQHANADQVNAISELVLNLLKTTFPSHPPSWHSFVPRLVARTPQRVMSMCSRTTLNLRTWVNLLQDANRERDEWKESCYYWKHNITCCIGSICISLNRFLCERCRNLEDGELCPECSNTPWKRCT